MTLFLSIVVGVLFAASVYLMLGRELKEVCIGFFLVTHAANLTIVQAGRVPGGLFPPLLGEGHPVEHLVDPLPQALVLTAIVIGFAVQGFLLTLLVVTWRRSRTVDVKDLAREPSDDVASEAAPSARPSREQDETVAARR